jgi:hypothetical protein
MSWKEFVCLILMLNFDIETFHHLFDNDLTCFLNMYFEKRQFFPFFSFFPVKTSFSHSHGFFQISRVFSQPWTPVFLKLFGSRHTQLKSEISRHTIQFFFILLPPNLLQWIPIVRTQNFEVFEFFEKNI